MQKEKYDLTWNFTGHGYGARLGIDGVQRLAKCQTALGLIGCETSRQPPVSVDD